MIIRGSLYDTKPCGVRLSACRLARKNAGADAGVAGRMPALRVPRESQFGGARLHCFHAEIDVLFEGHA
jgi:hypothetical protein